MTIFPPLQKIASQGIRTTLWVGIKFYIIAILFVAIVMTIFGYDKNIQVEINLIEYYQGFPRVLWIILWGPIIEELSFRLGLSFKKEHVLISAGCLLFFVIGSFLLPGNYTTLNFYIKIIITLLIVQILNKTITKTQLLKIETDYGRVITITSISLFALSHLYNCTVFDFNYILSYFIVLFPRFALGWVITYYRVTIGFIYGLIFHILVNVIGIVINLL